MTLQVLPEVPQTSMDRNLYMNEVAQAEARGESIPLEVYLFALRVVQEERASRLKNKTAKAEAKATSLQEKAQARADASAALKDFLGQ